MVEDKEIIKKYLRENMGYSVERIADLTDAGLIYEAICHVPQKLFDRIYKTLPDNIAFTFAAMRFFYKMHVNPSFYEDVKNAVAATAYETLRGQAGQGEQNNEIRL